MIDGLSLAFARFGNAIFLNIRIGKLVHSDALHVCPFCPWKPRGMHLQVIHQVQLLDPGGERVGRLHLCQQCFIRVEAS
jgi:hypothetical protein